MSPDEGRVVIKFHSQRHFHNSGVSPGVSFFILNSGTGTQRSVLREHLVS